MTTRIMMFGAFMIFMAPCFGFAADKRKFKHPSILTTQTGLATLKERITTVPSAKLGYEQLKQSKFADLSRPHTPYAVVKVVPSGSCKEEDAFRDDAHAAHATALMWVKTGDKRYRDKAMSILNDWSTTYEKIVVSNEFAAQAQLEAAWAAPIWTAAADIVRYYDGGSAGWKHDQIAAFDRFLNSMVKTARGARNSDNNWGTSSTLAIIAAAVYQEDEAAYTEAVALHKRHLRSISKKSGALGPDYLRDPWHPQYTVLTWINTCEIAWNQGDDLYGLKLDGQSVPRLAICLEHFAKLFLGKLPNPKGLRRGDYKDSHKKKQGYEMAFNHFIERQHLAKSIPTFVEMVPDWRPGGIDAHFVAWDTLTHGGLDSEQPPSMDQREQQQKKPDAGDGITSMISFGYESMRVLKLDEIPHFELIADQGSFAILHHNRH